MIDQREPKSGSYTELFFENIAGFQQIDPSIVQGIIRCVSASGMKTSDQDVLDHIKGDAVIVYVDDKTKDVIAFSSTSFVSPREHFDSPETPSEVGCYFVGATVAKDRQSDGLYTKMSERRIGLALDRGLSLVFTQTQNRSVLNGIQSALESIKEKGLITGYETQRVLRPGLYGRMLTAEMPLAFPDLDYSKGDAYSFFFHLQGVGKK